MSEPVTVTIERGAAVVNLDDGKANACGFAMLNAIGAALDRAAREAGSVVLFGRPGILSGGFDLKVIRGGDAGEIERMVTLGVRTLMRLYAHPQPVVVAATGHAVALGAFILLTGDYRFGTPGEFSIGLNETAIGLSLPPFGIELANARLAQRHIQHAAVNATMYAPEAALEVGFIDALAGADELRGRAVEKAHELARLDPAAFAANKAAFRAPLVSRVLSELPPLS